MTVSLDKLEEDLCLLREMWTDHTEVCVTCRTAVWDASAPLQSFLCQSGVKLTNQWCGLMAQVAAVLYPR